MGWVRNMRPRRKKGGRGGRQICDVRDRGPDKTNKQTKKDFCKDLTFILRIPHKWKHVFESQEKTGANI